MKIDVAAHISTLLYEHNRVIIPGLGVFVTVDKPAEINKYQQVSPTTKGIVFDKSKNLKDSLLAQKIATEQQISLTKAHEIISDYVKNVKNNLTTQAVSVSNIGRLFLDANKEITFAPSNTNFSNNTYGLPKLDFSPINRQTKQIAIQPVEIAPIQESNGLKAFFTNIWKDASIRTILVILILLFIIFQISRLVNNDSEILVPFIIDTQENVLDTETTHDPYENTLEEIPTVITEQEEVIEEIIEEDKRINLRPKVNSTNTEQATTENLPEVEVATTNKKTIIVIIGNFQTQSNADLAASQVKKAGYIAYMKKLSVDKHRVGIALNIAADDLKPTLEEIKKIFPDAWVMNQ
jgi:nucleoid DNA-binding protein